LKQSAVPLHYCCNATIACHRGKQPKGRVKKINVHVAVFPRFSEIVEKKQAKTAVSTSVAVKNLLLRSDCY